MAVAIRRAGPAIVASAGTVIVSLLTLLLASLNSTKSMGPVLAIGVAVALRVDDDAAARAARGTGRWVFWPVKPAFGTPEPTATGFWARTRAPHRPAAARCLGRHRDRARRDGGRAGRAARDGLTNAQSFRGTPDSVAGQPCSTRTSRPGRTAGPGVRQSGLGPRDRRRARVGARADRRDRRRRRSRATPTLRPPSPPRRTARRPTRPSTGPATRCTPFPARTRSSAGIRRSTLTSQRAAAMTGR